MVMIKVPGVKKAPTFNKERRNPAAVLGIVDPGASPRGNSYWKVLRGCPREHALRHVVGLHQEGDQEALTVGLTFHYALEVYYGVIGAHQAAIDGGTRPLNPTPEYFWGATGAAEKAAWAALAPMLEEPGYEDTYAELERMLASYFDAYRRTDRWRVISVEETLEYSDADLEYSARLDLIVEDYDRGGMWVIEHKSARAITADLVEGYQMDQQILGQVWLLQRCVDLAQYPLLRGVTINLTTKHKTPKHQRVDVMPSKAHTAAFEASLRAWGNVAAVFEELGYPKALGNCSGPMHYFKKCEFFNVCHGDPQATVADFQRMDPPMSFVKSKKSV